MAKRVVIVGGGIIGAAAAYRLARAGADVLVIDAGVGTATVASFGWLNASFYLSEAHFRLRVEGLAAYRRLLAELDVPVRFCGCLSTEHQGAGGERRHEVDEEGAALRAEARRLGAMGYDARVIDGPAFARLEPAVAPPDEALHFPGEGIAEPAELARALMTAAIGRGARVLAGLRADRLMAEGGRIAGVVTPAGPVRADEVLVAAGTEALLATADLPLPMVPRPAYVVESHPVAPVLTHVLATPEGELRQRPDGVLVMPAAVSHQGDSAEAVSMTPEAAAEATTQRIRALLPGVALDWAQVRLAHRPMPADGLPAVGRLAPGLTVAVMHSGMTLAAITGECLAREVLDGPSNATEALLADFRPERFAAT